MLHIRTPLILHPTLSTASRRIWLKLENLQPCGSFKLRGMGPWCRAGGGLAGRAYRRVRS